MNPRPPSYRLHKQSGQAIVTLNGRDHLLGRHGTPESKDKYNRLIAEWIAAFPAKSYPGESGPVPIHPPPSAERPSRRPPRASGLRRRPPRRRRAPTPWRGYGSR